MKHLAWFALIVSVAACGGKSGGPAGPGGGGTGGGGTGGGGGAASTGAVELWAAVMQPGAVFSFNDRMEGSDEFITVEATVTTVDDVDGGKRAHLAWTENDSPLDGSLPAVIQVTDKGVWLASSDDATDGEVWPASIAVMDKPEEGQTRYIHPGEMNGELCYGLGPSEDAGECEDVCFTELCVHPRHGLMGGSGTWWPNYSVFTRRDLRK